MVIPDNLIKSSRLVVRTAIVINRLFLVAVVAGLLLSFVYPAQFAALLLDQPPPQDPHSATTGLRLLLVLGLAMAVASDILLAALAQIVSSAGASDPFVLANAHRLQTIAWALLALQLLDIPGALLDKYFPSLGSAAPGVTFSPGGWIAVLMVFVLSRIFAAGSAMREELEGIV